LKNAFVGGLWFGEAVPVDGTVKPRFTAGFGRNETSAVNRGSRQIGVLLVLFDEIIPEY